MLCIFIPLQHRSCSVCMSFVHPAGPPQQVDWLDPRWKITLKCLSQGHIKYCSISMMICFPLLTKNILHLRYLRIFSEKTFKHSTNCKKTYFRTLVGHEHYLKINFQYPCKFIMLNSVLLFYWKSTQKIHFYILILIAVLRLLWGCCFGTLHENVKVTLFLLYDFIWESGCNHSHCLELFVLAPPI